MPYTTSGAAEHRSRHRRVLLWSCIVTILSLPLSSAFFLRFFDSGSSGLFTVICLPVLIFYYQGILAGLVLNVCLAGCTFFPVYFIVRRFFEGRSSNSLTVETPERVVAERVPLSARVLAIVDFLIAVVIAISAIDSPIVSLVVLIFTGPVVFGVFNVKPWGWWAGMIFHGLIAIGILVAWVVAMFLLIQDFDRPRGHMEIVSNEAAAVIMTIVFLVFEILSVVPLLLLTRNKTRRCFFSGHE
ncbi:MAG: hypothetical protein KDB01_08475 [Planctomycetaceae bacterium]|nr:hypothetical protein [Planctomycetaceae bacterium]